jgi:hypothetical protein
MQAAAGAPLSLTVYVNDDSKREKESIAIKERAQAKSAINVTWFKHAGPGPVVFSQPKTPIAETQGSATTLATFTQPGEYVLRVRGDIFGRTDTSAGNQCCWTNGYVKVTVTP